MEKLKLLFAVLVCYRHNLHMLHWKVVGKRFDRIHGMCDDYVDKFNTFIDEIAEIILSMDGNPLTLPECITLLTESDNNFLLVDSTEDYESEKVIEAVDKMFTELYTLYEEVGRDIEYSDITSKLDEHKYWLRIESKYKNKKRMID